MRITPLGLRNHDFRRRWSGYAQDEVDEFLRLVSEDYEATLRELETQRDQVMRLEHRVEELGANAQVLQDTLTTAQKLSEAMKRTATKEAEILVREAEVKGEKILEAAHRRASALAEDIREMKQLKARLAASVRSVVQTHLHLLDGLAEEPTADAQLDRKVSVLRRPTPSAKATRER